MRDCKINRRAKPNTDDATVPPILDSTEPVHRTVTESSSGTTIPYSAFRTWGKAVIVIMVSVAATFSAFSSNIYFPAIPSIALDLSVSAELINLTVTTYMIFQGLTPTIWGALADVFGRRVIYICTFVIYIGACIGLAETQQFYQLAILRCLQSTGSASTIAIGAGVLGDVTTREERGGYIGIYQAGLLVPLALGPILGGVLAETLGWRAIFWFLTIYAGVFLLVLVLVMPETLRILVGDGSIQPKGLSRYPLQRLMQPRPRPQSTLAIPPSISPAKPSVNLLGSFKILIDKRVSICILFLTFYYTVWQMTIAAMSTLFKQTYDLDELQIGLTFIANGVGCMLGTIVTGKYLDVEYKRFKSGYTGPRHEFPLEKARLGSLWILALVECAATLVFGWTLDKGVHISVPIIATFFLGWAACSIQGIITTYTVDVFVSTGATATASLNLARCLVGAGGTAAILPIQQALGSGWAFTLFTGILLCAIGLFFIHMKYAPRWRKT